MTGETSRPKVIASTTVDHEEFPSEGKNPDAQSPVRSAPSEWLVIESSEQVDSEGPFPSEYGCPQLLRVVVAEPPVRAAGPEPVPAADGEPDLLIDDGRKWPDVDAVMPFALMPTETFDLPFVYGSGEEGTVRNPSVLRRTLRYVFVGGSRISSKIGTYARTRVHAARAALSSVYRKTADAARQSAFATVRAISRAVATGRVRAPLIMRASQRLAAATLGAVGRTIRAALRSSRGTMILVGRYGVVTTHATVSALNRLASRYQFAGNMEARAAAIRTIVDGRLGVLACGVVLGAAGVLLLQQVSSVATVATPPLARDQSSGAILQVGTNLSVLPSQIGGNGGRANLTDRNLPAEVPAAAPRPRAGPRFRGTLTVRSSPAGARVFLNGVLAGTTPLLLSNLAVGSRAMRLERDGYVRWSSTVRIVANQRTFIAATLRPSSSGD